MTNFVEEFSRFIKQEPEDPLQNVLDLYGKAYDQLEEYWKVRCKYPDEGHIFLAEYFIDLLENGSFPEEKARELHKGLVQTQADISELIEKVEHSFKGWRNRIIKRINKAEDCMIDYLTSKGVNFTVWDERLGRGQLITNALYRDNRFVYIRNLRTNVVSRCSSYTGYNFMAGTSTKQMRTGYN